MDTQSFWNVIEQYNQNTIIITSILFVLIVTAVILSYTHKIVYSAKLILGIANLFIGVVFFGCYGTQLIQKIFALPLFFICGILFLYEAFDNKKDILEKPDIFQALLLLLYCLYPIVSLALGNRFPRMVTYIMPCPIVSLSIAVYAGYTRKNKWLLLLLTLWGMTGIKSMIFAVYEDIILLLCGIYGIYLLIKETRLLKVRKEDR